MDLHAGCGFLGPYRLYLLKHLAVIKLTFIQGALDQG